MAEAAMTDAERPWIRHYPEGIAWDTKVDTTPVHEQVLATCTSVPGRVALDFLGKKMTFGELGKAINAFAGALQSRFGVRKGSRVALLLPNCPFYVVAYYAILRTGAAVVNCNPLYTVPELTHIVANSGADLMVTLDLKQLFEKAEALTEAGQVKSLVVCRFPDALPGAKRLLFRLVRGKDLAKVTDSRIAAKITRYEDMLARNLAPGPVTIDAARDIAVQQYTGGTTGQPKGAMLSHANIAANAAQARLWFARVCQPGKAGIAVLPFFHIFAMTSCLNLPLTSGMTMYLLPRFELKAFLDLLAHSGASLLPAVPTLITALAHKPSVTARHLRALELVVSGGAPLPGELRDAFAAKSNARLVEGYGLTEASPVVCCGPLDGLNKPMSIGLPFPGTDIRFVDIETGRVVGLGERGELQVKGPQVMLGYHNDEQATRDAFVDGWLRTGDVGYIDEDGYVFLVDRIKDLIITSGYNVYPRVIEEAILHHHDVDEVSVIGAPDEYRGEAPVAFVKRREGGTVTEAELRKFLAERLNKLEMPKQIIFKDQLPKTMIGKLSKKELREEYAAMKEKSSEPA